MRLKSVCNVSLRIISGLKMFTKKMFAPPPSKDSSTSETKPQRELSPGEIIDKAIARLNLTMIEIQDTPSILHLMRSQLFYDTYDSMIYLCLSSLLAYGWSLAYSCYSPQSSSTSSYCWIVIIILVLMLYSVQILLQIMYMTGFTAKETRLALAMGATVGALSVVLFVMHASYVSDSTSEAIAIHLNALVMQLNGSVVLLSTGQLKPIIYIALSALLSLLSMGLVIPAVRFASTFNKIISGSGTTPHLTFYRKAMMFSDIVLPFLVAIIYSSVPDLLFGIHGGNNTGHSGSSSNSSSSSSYLGSIDAVMSCSSSSDDATCLTSDDAGMGMDVAGYSKYPSDHHPYESGLLVAQLVVVLLMVFTRWSNLQAHLQTHLDSLVHLVAAQIIAPNGVSEESIATLQLKVKVCLPAAHHGSSPVSSSLVIYSIVYHLSHHLSCITHHHLSLIIIIIYPIIIIIYSSALYGLPDGCYLPVRRSATVRRGLCSATTSKQSHRHWGVLWTLQPHRYRNRRKEREREEGGRQCRVVRTDVSACSE